MNAAPRTHMHYARIIEVESTPSSGKKIVILDAPHHGEASFKLFHSTNSLFNHLIHHYATWVHMPGEIVKKYGTHPNHRNIYKYSSPGIVFRNVLIKDLLERLQEQVELFPAVGIDDKSNHNTFHNLLRVLEWFALEDKHINVYFAHKKAEVDQFVTKYIAKYESHLLSSQSGMLAEDRINVLHFVRPLRTQRKTPPYTEFSRKEVSVKMANQMDAVKLMTKEGKGREQYEVMSGFEHYVEAQKDTKKLRRSWGAPPLLHVTLLDPEYKEMVRSKAILHNEEDFAEFPPTAYILYPPEPKKRSNFSIVVNNGKSPSPLKRPCTNTNKSSSSSTSLSSSSP